MKVNSILHVMQSFLLPYLQITIFSAISNYLAKLSSTVLMAIYISDFDLCNSFNLYSYLYRYFHLFITFCLFCLFVRADCSLANFLFSWNTAFIFKFGACSIFRSLYSSVGFINYLPSHTKIQILHFDLFLFQLPFWNYISQLRISRSSIALFIHTTFTVYWSRTND